MKTTLNDKGETVIEYSFADWEQGLAFDTKAPYTNRKVTEVKTGIATYYNLPSKEHAKIQEASKALYKKKAIARAVEIRDAFYKKLANSEAKETLVIQEIEKCEAILLPNKINGKIIFGNEHPIKGVHWNATQIAGIKDLYQKLIIEGNRDYSVVSHPNCQVKSGVGDFWHIETEALSKFYEHLKNFDLDAFNRNDPPFIHALKKIPLNIFLEKSGLMDRLKKYGAPINPIHNFKMLVEARQEVYEKLKTEFVAECELNKTPIDSDDWVLFNQLHWDNELTLANEWIKEQKDRKHPSAAILVQLSKYKGYVEQQLAQPTKGKPKDKPAQPQTLKEIWEGSDEDYDKLIKLLKSHQRAIGTSFLNEINGKLVWNKQPPKGFAQYLAGLFYTLTDKKLIKYEYSAPHITKIILNTFNISVDSKPFRTLKGTPPNEMYTKPFKGLIPNLK